MPRKKLDGEEKISAEETKVKRKRRKISDTEKKSAEVKTVKRVRRKISAETPEQKNISPKVDYKNDGREKIFALDIGTRSVIGIVAEKDSNGQLEIISTYRVEHGTRAMLDGQIHDVPQVSAVIKKVCEELAKKVGKLKNAAVAAAGRALYTVTANSELEIHGGVISAEQQNNLDFAGVQIAQNELANSQMIKDPTSYYCVGFSVVSYELDGIRLKSLIGQRGRHATAKVIATFLPRQVIDSMQTALNYSNLEMRALTLEPIAAINVLIPPTMRHLNLVLVDIGAGTSDVAITKNGSVIAYGMVPVAGDEITEALSQKFLLDFNVAEKVKRQAAAGESATFGDILGGTHELTAEKIVDSIGENISHLADAIAKTVLELNGKEIPQAVILVGGGSLTPRLTKYVATALNMPENRVAVRRPDVVEEIKNIPPELCRPDAVTPLGILKIASINTFHFLTVHVNDEEYSLFHFRELTVGDALLNAGIQLRKWNGKPGLGLMVMVDGEKKVFRGSMGTLARIFLDDEETSLDSPLKNNCKIRVERGRDGKPPELNLGEVITAEPSFNVQINGKDETVTPKLSVNGEISLPTRILKDGDEIKTLAPRTIGEVLRMAGYPPTGKKIQYTLNGKKSHYNCTPEILLDGEEVQISLPIHADDKLEYIAKDTPKVSDIINISGINSSIKIFYGGEEFEIPTMASIDLAVNGRPATMNTLIDDGAEIGYKKTEKKFVTVSDALLAVKFQPPPAKSRMSFIIKVNGVPADFASPMKDGDKLEVILKTHDGQELSSVEKKLAGDLSQVEKIHPSQNLMNEIKSQRKLTIQDFIRND